MEGFYNRAQGSIVSTKNVFFEFLNEILHPLQDGAFIIITRIFL